MRAMHPLRFRLQIQPLHSIHLLLHLIHLVFDLVFLIFNLSHFPPDRLQLPNIYHRPAPYVLGHLIQLSDQLLKRFRWTLHLQNGDGGVEGLNDRAHQVAQGDQVLLLQFLLGQAALEDRLVTFEQFLQLLVLVAEDLVSLLQLF